MASLRELRVLDKSASGYDDYNGARPTAYAAAVGSCAQLERLELHRPHEMFLARLLCGGGLSQSLHTLCLEHVSARGYYDPTWGAYRMRQADEFNEEEAEGAQQQPAWKMVPVNSLACFTSLQALTSLELHQCFSVDLILVALMELPLARRRALRSLRIEAHDLTDDDNTSENDTDPHPARRIPRFGSAVPSASALGDVLRLCKHAFVSLRLPALDGWLHRSGVVGRGCGPFPFHIQVADARWSLVRASFHPLLARSRLRQRFEVVVQNDE
jgi:hypothetical protein